MACAVEKKMSNKPYWHFESCWSSRERFFEAMHNKEGKEFIQARLKRGKCINSLKFDGDTLLSNAAEFGDRRIVEYLLKIGADASVKNGNGTTPIHMAAGFGHKDVVECLLDFGILVDAHDIYKHTPLHYAVVKNQEQVVEFLIKKGANMEAKVDRTTPILLAAKNSRRGGVKLLTDILAGIGNDSYNKWQLLHFAAHEGWLEIIETLESKLNFKSWEGMTPLILATTQKTCLEVVQYLVEGGADINAITADGKTALHLASETKQMGVVQHLLLSGADCNIENESGVTLLNFVVQRWRDIRLIRLLIENGAYFKPIDYVKIRTNGLLRKNLLKDVQLCTKAIVNKFNNSDLAALYKLPIPDQNLPSVEQMKMTSSKEMMQEIEMIVEHEIQTKGYCNVLEARPICLKMLCVKSFLDYYYSITEKSKLKKSATRSRKKKSICERRLDNRP